VLLTYDNNRDVRRAALLNIPLMSETMDAVLARTRDTDTTVRKLVFSSVLDKNTTINDDEMGPTHPRALKIAQREVIVRNGLGDREPSVRAVAGVLMSTWMMSSKADSTEEKVINFLKLFDLTDNTVAEDALLSVFLTDPEVFDGLEFPGERP
jgi:condensin complex subunit 3